MVVQPLRDLEDQMMKLPDGDRALLAAHLLESLPAVLSDPDDGVAEAVRRDAELDRNPDSAIDLGELRKRVGKG